MTPWRRARNARLRLARRSEGRRYVTAKSEKAKSKKQKAKSKKQKAKSKKQKAKSKKQKADPSHRSQTARAGSG
jgi:epoxyqueuosine reductase QueG